MQDDQRKGGNHDLKREGEAYLLPGRVEQLEHEQSELKKNDQDYKQKDIGYKARQLVLDGRLVKLTGWLVVVGLLGTGISIWQSRIAQRAATAARDAAVAATSAVNATENQIVIQLGQMDLMREQMTAATKQVDAAIAAVDESRRANMLSSSGLDLTRQQIHSGQRAWLIPARVALNTPVAAGNAFGISYWVKNSGPTPAREVASWASFDLRPQSAGLPPLVQRARTVNPVQPGSTSVLGATAEGGWAPTWWFNDNPNRPMTQAEFDGIQRGDRLYAVIYVEYRDVFQRDTDPPNLTIYCMVYDTTAANRAGGMVACNGGHVMR